MTTQAARTRAAAGLNKVPHVTAYFWLVKVLCVPVGGRTAGYVEDRLGLGPLDTTTLFVTALILALIVQFRLDRYVPAVYWLVVLLTGMVATMAVDDLTGIRHVPLSVSTIACAALLLVVFAAWYACERTLAIDAIVTLRREAFYWLAALVTFALGVSGGDWTLRLTNWTSGTVITLSAALLVVVLGAWRMGAGVVLAFWLAYGLTAPLAANIGDYLATSEADGGLGLGTLGTTVIFLTAILLTVLYLTVTRRDRTERDTEAAY